VWQIFVEKRVHIFAFCSTLFYQCMPRQNFNKWINFSLGAEAFQLLHIFWKGQLLAWVEAAPRRIHGIPWQEIF
jgi:hypothetical protein